MVGARRVPGTTGCTPRNPEGWEEAKFCRQHLLALGARGKDGLGVGKDDCTYFSSTLFIENVQTCKCEINVLNSPWAPGIK